VGLGPDAALSIACSLSFCLSLASILSSSWCSSKGCLLTVLSCLSEILALLGGGCLDPLVLSISLEDTSEIAITR